MVKLTESAVYIRTKSSIENVKKLNLWGCGVDDISVCEKMHLLEVLSLSVNDVKSLEPLQYCKNLKELYMRKNQIESLDELRYLKDLPNLRVLWIDENPCVAESGPEYRKKVIRMLPQITKLDDKPITSNDLNDDSVPECDFHSHRSNSISNDPMTRSIYVQGPSVIEKVMQPQMLHFGDTSDEEKPNNYSIDLPGIPLTEEKTTIYLSDNHTLPRCNSRQQNMMSQSMYGNMCTTLTEEPSSADGEDGWNDFGIDEDLHHPMPICSHRMYQSVHEGMGMIQENNRRPAYGRSMSMPRRRATSRANSNSPAREQRLQKIMSAVSVLLDELDADGLRQVVDEAQNRMKKRR